MNTKLQIAFLSTFIAGAFSVGAATVVLPPMPAPDYDIEFVAAPNTITPPPPPPPAKPGPAHKPKDPTPSAPPANNYGYPSLPEPVHVPVTPSAPPAEPNYGYPSLPMPALPMPVPSAPPLEPVASKPASQSNSRPKPQNVTVAVVVPSAPIITGWDVASAARRGDTWWIRRNKRDVQRYVNSSYLPLHIALENGHPDVAKLLLECGANVSLVDSDGNTPLMLALKNSYIGNDTIKLLLGYGARFDVRNKKGQYPIMFAMSSVSRVRWLLENYKINTQVCDASGKSVIMYALEKNMPIDVVDELVKQGARLDASYEGVTPLMFAIKSGYIYLAKFLRAYDCDVATRDSKGENSLFYAVRYGSYETFRLVSSYGGSFDTRNNDGQTLLMVALATGWSGIRQMLNNVNVPWDCVDCQGRSTIAYAVESNDCCVVKELLARKPHQTMVRQGDTFLLKTALRKNNHEMVRLILDQGVCVRSSTSQNLLYDAVDGDMTELLVQRGADVNMIDASHSRETVLMDALIHGQNKKVYALLEHDADVTTRGINGQTTLMYAAQNEKITTDIIGLLLERGVGINDKDLDGRTALIHAAIKRNINCGCFLMDRGADKTIKDRFGKVAQDYDPLVKRLWRKVVSVPGMLTAATAVGLAGWLTYAAQNNKYPWAKGRFNLRFK
jgi:ankyrin repeat protein